MIKKKSIIQQMIIVALLGFFIFIIWISLYSNFHASQSNNLQLISSQTVNNQHMTEITGRIKNNTNKEFLYTNVVINLYDATGNKVGDAVDNSGDLKSGAIWNFDAIGALTNAKTYKVVQMTGK